MVADHGQIRREESGLADAAHALPDIRRVADRTGSLQQRCAHHDRGAGVGAGRHAIAAHQFAGRSHRAADGVLRPHRAQHAAHPPERGADHPCGRSAGWFLLRGGVDACAGNACQSDHRRSGSDGRHDQGGRSRHSQAAHRGSGGAAAGARGPRRGRDRRRQQIPTEGRRPGRCARYRQRRRARLPDRAAEIGPCQTRRSQNQGCARRYRGRCEGQCQFAGTGGGSCPRARNCGRNLGRHGKSFWPPPRGNPFHQRRLWRRL